MTQWVSLRLFRVSWVGDYLQEHGHLTSGYTTEKNVGPSPFNQYLPANPQRRVGTHESPIHPWWDWASCIDPVQVIIALWAQECNSHVMPGKQHSIISHPSCTTLFPSLLPRCFLSLGGGKWNQCLLCDWVSSSYLFSSLWPIMVTRFWQFTWDFG